MPPKQTAKKKATNGYKMPEAIHPGEVLTDLSKKQWILGPSIGKGGFGEIYSARDSSSKDYKYVVKIEPHSNGPLFVEMHFYIKFGKAEMVGEFCKEKNLKNFGMPIYHGHGSHEYKNEKYRFLVLDKLGTDLDKIFLDNKKQFDTGTVFKLAVQVLDVLEYIHQKEYVHADIKGANILMGTTKETSNQAYLVDFGLACKYTTESQFKPNPKKAHDGTIEYLSRDAHKGVQTRRGDLEILAYNIIHWLGCPLPWEKKIADPNAVHASKTECMADLPEFMKTCFTSQDSPAGLVKFLQYINDLGHITKPDYKKVRNMFIKEINAAGDSMDKPMKFAKPKKPTLNRRSSLKRKSSGRPSLSVSVVVRKKLTKKITKPSPKKEVIREPKVKADAVNKPSSDYPYNGLTPQMQAILEKKRAKDKVKKVTKVKAVKKGNINGTHTPANDDEITTEDSESTSVPLKKKTEVVAKAKVTKARAKDHNVSPTKRKSNEIENDEIKNVRRKIALKKGR